MHTYLLNIGNTHTQLAHCPANCNTPVLLATYDTRTLLDANGHIPLLDTAEQDAAVIASSVVPALTKALAAAYPQITMQFLSWLDFPQIDFSAVNTQTLGNDRICDVAAALEYIGSGPFIVLDCGTCITINVIDAQRAFIGGAIVPGRALLRKALHDYTAQLPLVPLSHDIPPPCGATTPQAILAGTDIGCIGALRELLLKTRDDVLKAPAAPILATGGDTPFFLNALSELLSPAPELLTLRGVLTAKQS